MPKKILVIDDDPDVRHTICKSLMAEHFNGGTFSSDRGNGR